jgi:hypothetical protein
MDNTPNERWHVKMMQPRIPWETHPLLPADVGGELCAVILNRGNLLEDAHYQKVVPNRFRVELNAENYARNYQPLEMHVIQQWQNRLVECLATANSRLGRKEYILAGSVRIEIRPAADLKSNQARIFSLIQPDRTASGEPVRPVIAQAPPAPRPSRPAPVPLPHVQPIKACLEQLPSGRRWALYPGILTI